ncbi:ABC transporter permease [Aquimarina sp. AD10]|uniref:ABC transporter permease n=1 Tax=Aquimarina sp. AD10 TaxID=1714849 RepID=UPI000E53BDA9|nr:ABC transporter permease [Aquimarina sp. AD10]AXT63767.1 ABC transporter permease [Aquimarina sp. AD10]RKN00798.1 ABC transporter permease [Aquimarina sp. AD10]
MSNLKLIIKREFIARVRNKTFVVMTFLSPLIFVGMIGLITWLTTLNKDEIREIAIVDETGSFEPYFKSSKGISYIDYTNLPLNDAKDSVVIKDLYGLLYIPGNTSNKELEKSIQFYADEAPNIDILQQIEKIISEELTHQNFKKKGVDIAVIESSKAKVDIQIENFLGEKTSKISSYVKMFFGGLAGYLLLMFVVIYGNMVMRSVIEEKTSRIIEVIISSVKPVQLMIGKILGTTLAGVLQFFIWVIIGGVLLFIASFYLGIDVQPTTPAQIPQDELMEQSQLILQDVLNLPLVSLVVLFLVYFIGGYFLYSSIYAAIGAAVDSETDSQQFMLPIIVPLMLAFYVGVFAVIENPHGTISTVFSMIPLTSPIVMLMRVPFGVDWWQILISIVILIASIWFMVMFAAKIYRIGILMYGKKPSYKEIFKWLKY